MRERDGGSVWVFLGEGEGRGEGGESDYIVSASPLATWTVPAELDVMLEADSVSWERVKGVLVIAFRGRLGNPSWILFFF